MARDEAILVQILDDMGEAHCSACGSAWPAQSAYGGAEMVAEYLERIYGEAVRVVFIDLAEASRSSAHAQLTEQVRRQGMMLPVVAINGKLRLSGALDGERIADIIETLREVGHG